MKTTLLALILLAVLLVAAPLHFFADEPDNFLGGKIIANGGALYVDYWSHHTPVMYQLCAVFYTLGARTYLQFRLMWAVLVWLFGMALYRVLRSPLVLWIWLMLAVTAPITGANMVMAESLTGYLAITAWLILTKGQDETYSADTDALADTDVRVETGLSGGVPVPAAGFSKTGPPCFRA